MRLGYEVRAGAHHYKIRLLNGGPLVIVPFNGADGRRHVKNMVANLRRIGYHDLADKADPRVRPLIPEPRLEWET